MGWNGLDRWDKPDLAMATMLVGEQLAIDRWEGRSLVDCCWVGEWSNSDGSEDNLTLYSAIRVDETGEVFALIALVEWVQEGTGGELLTKFSDESAGEKRYDCPVRVLDKLTPTDAEHAIKWRSKCRSRNIQVDDDQKIVSVGHWRRKVAA